MFQSQFCISLPALPHVFTGCVPWCCGRYLWGFQRRQRHGPCPPGDYNLIVATKHTHEIVGQKWEVDLIRWLTVRCRQQELKARGLGRGSLVSSHSRNDGHGHALGTPRVSCRRLDTLCILSPCLLLQLLYMALFPSHLEK